MNIQIDLPPQEIAALMNATCLQDEAAAVVMAAREFLRLRHLRELKTVSGKVEYEANWQEQEALELAEIEFPQ